MQNDNGISIFIDRYDQWRWNFLFPGSSVRNLHYYILLHQQDSGNDISDIFFLILTFMFCRPQHASLVYDMVHEFYIGDLEPGAWSRY